MEKNKVQIIGDGICWLEEQVTWISFLIMLGLLLIQVLLRYVLNMPLAWAEEIVRFVYIGVSFTGAAVAVRRTEHITINIIPLLFNKIFKHDERKVNLTLDVLDILAFIICSLFWVYITKAVGNYMLETKEGAMLTVAMQWPMWIVYLPIVLSGVMIVLHYVLNIFEKFIEMKNTLKGGTAQ